MLTDAIGIGARVDVRRDITRVGDDAYVTRQRRAALVLDEDGGGLKAAKHEASVAMIDGAARDAVEEIAERDADGCHVVNADDLRRASGLAEGALELDVVVTEALLLHGGIVALDAVGLDVETARDLRVVECEFHDVLEKMGIAQENKRVSGATVL